ncbi:hypothetical protein EDD86DRAFT_248757 [Gorgonomyces haynaldii]|nr:hypothetical protein EDD86DRAFT_248757 [Gorgonomyces haynaldii]
MGVFDNQIVNSAFLVYFVLQSIVYLTVTRSFERFKTPKSRAWFLTCLVGFYIIPIGSLYTWKIIVEKDMSWLRNDLGYVTAGVFAAFLAGDLVYAQIDYRSQMQIGTGYIHHIVYLSMIAEFLRINTSGPMIMLGVEEIPTWLLAFGTMFPEYRTDLGFGITFLLTRIIMHAVYLVQYWYLLPGHYYLFMVATLPVHINWFYGWCIKFGKYKSKKNE